MRAYLKNKLVKQGRGERGFTLIEMLVVVWIIVSLAAIVVPTVIKWASEGEEAALGGEWDAVQGAIDGMMADQKLVEVEPGAPADKITLLTDFGVGPLVQTLDEYLRDDETSYCYTWDDTGKVLTQSPSPC